MKAAEIHAQLGADGWRIVLSQLGVPPAALCNRHQPCPACGGRDRFRFDNRHGRGDYICGQCGAGDGFALLQKLHRWDFQTARREVMRTAGITEDRSEVSAPRVPVAAPPAQSIAVPTSRVTRIVTGSCSISDCPDAVKYLEGRELWPLPEGHGLRAHVAVEYFDADRKLIGRYPALVAPVRDCDGQLVTVHVTYLDRGAKLDVPEARKILSPMTGREGCAVRLMSFEGGALGVAEGIETAFSAARLHGLPVWAALNTSLLAKFEPPENVTLLHVFPDRDAGGFEAAAKLMERLQGRVAFEMHAPPPNPGVKDWNDALRGRRAA